MLITWLGTNFCDLTARIVGCGSRRRIVLFGTIDNLIKGASGQAVQNMNIVFGLGETTGLLATDTTTKVHAD